MYKYENYKGAKIEELINALLEDNFCVNIKTQTEEYMGQLIAYEIYKAQTPENAKVYADFEDGIIDYVLSMVKEEEEEENTDLFWNTMVIFD